MLHWVVILLTRLKSSETDTSRPTLLDGLVFTYLDTHCVQVFSIIGSHTKGKREKEQKRRRVGGKEHIYALFRPTYSSKQVE